MFSKGLTNWPGFLIFEAIFQMCFFNELAKLRVSPLVSSINYPKDTGIIKSSLPFSLTRIKKQIKRPAGRPLCCEILHVIYKLVESRQMHFHQLNGI